MVLSTSAFTISQERALAICPKISSSISIPCSFAIIYEVLYIKRTKGTMTPIHRVLLAMSVVEILASFAWFLSTWAVPRGSFAFATGNIATCNFQGFLLQLAIGAPLYNSSLAIFYLLIIKKRWTDDQLRKIETTIHAAILSFAVGTSILLLRLGLYNHVGAVCWVIGDPAECGNSSYQPSDVPCLRGDNAWLWGLALFYGPLWFCVIACCIAMIILWLEVHKTHNNSRRYSRAIEGMENVVNRSSRCDEKQVAIQAILFCLTFVITWMPSTLWSIAHWFNWTHFALDIASAIAEPLQGFWNFLIFLKSRPETVKRLKKYIKSILPCCCYCIRDDVNESSLNHHNRESFATVLKNRFSILSQSISRTDTAIDDVRRSSSISRQYGMAIDEVSKSFAHDNFGEESVHNITTSCPTSHNMEFDVSENSMDDEPNCSGKNCEDDNTESLKYTTNKEIIASMSNDNVIQSQNASSSMNESIDLPDIKTDIGYIIESDSVNVIKSTNHEDNTAINDDVVNEHYANSSISSAIHKELDLVIMLHDVASSG